MLSLRPHTLKWTTAGGPPTEDPVTGYPIPGTPGEAKEIACRFHLESTKVYKNEDSTESRQIGQVRCDVGTIPEVGQTIEVVNNQNPSIVHFSGVVRAVFHGQLSHRLEV
ncbi:hypothetical protein [Pedobacter sp. Leaf170]|uniref:hypothetical protein n=1 Tax=Pedobacter sp. Leaf170 TaxID=2876558 RepID=UPI001E2BE881|nr:hypothetical protein [Pedobacter sp. Leaf170]